MDNALQGIIHGKTVQLSSDPGLEQGQPVEVVLRPVSNTEQPVRSAAGMLSNIPGLDESLNEIQQYRKQAQNRMDSL